MVESRITNWGAGGKGRRCGTFNVLNFSAKTSTEPISRGSATDSAGTEPEKWVLGWADLTF